MCPQLVARSHSPEASFHLVEHLSPLSQADRQRDALRTGARGPHIDSLIDACDLEKIIESRERGLHAMPGFK